MDLDKFLKSQTFKTGLFVLLILFVLVLVFKIGVVYGHKKAHFSYKHDFNHHRVIESKFFGHQKGVFSKKDILKSSYLKRHIMKIEALFDSVVENESDAEDLSEEE